MRAFVINLERQPARLDGFRARNEWMFNQHGGRLFCERFDAVDGRRIDGPPWLTPPARGCALSHIELWQRAARFAEPTLICEDDATVLEADYEAELGSTDTWLALGFNWDAPVALSYGLGPVVVHHNQETLRQLLDTDGISPSTERLITWPLHHAFGTPAYIVTPTGAQWLLENALPLRDAHILMPTLGYRVHNRGIDCQLNLHYETMGARVLFPPRAFTPNRRERNDV